MVDRINLILKAKNLTSRQFAEEIGIQPSGMSHILSGRNRPSLDFVMKVINRYPEIDLKWLTLGEGEMYNTDGASVQKKERRSQPDLFSSVEDTETDEGVDRIVPYVSPEADGDGQETEIDSTIDEAAKTVAEPLSVKTTNPVSVSVSGLEPEAAPISSDVSSRTQSMVSEPVSDAQSVPLQESVQVHVSEPVLEPKQSHTAEPFPSANYTGSETTPYSNKHRKRIVKFVVLYDDHTFSEYYPE